MAFHSENTRTESESQSKPHLISERNKKSKKSKKDRLKTIRKCSPDSIREGRKRTKTRRINSSMRKRTRVASKMGCL
jgi:hypothetical protein